MVVVRVQKRETVEKEGKYERKTLERQKTANIAKEVTKTMSCWRTVGCGGLVIILSMLLISILQFVIFYIYANPTGTTSLKELVDQQYGFFFCFLYCIFYNCFTLHTGNTL